LPLHPLHQDEKQPDTELFFRAVPFILNCLLERLGERGGAEGKKRIVSEKGERWEKLVGLQ